jgi:hypothetical protein
MSTFNIGDKVVMAKPSDVEDGPGWLNCMDKHDREVGVINEICSNGNIRIEGERYVLSPSWLTLVAGEVKPSKPTPEKDEVIIYSGDNIYNLTLGQINHDAVSDIEARIKADRALVRAYKARYKKYMK